jgi:hypothetical protein
MFRHSEKSSNVSKNSSKKYQLRADVKQKIKQRLHRDKPKEDCTNNRTGTGYQSYNMLYTRGNQAFSQDPKRGRPILVQRYITTICNQLVSVQIFS